MTTMTRISLLLMVVFFLTSAAQAEPVTFNEGDTASKIAASHFGDFHQATNLRFAHKESGKVFQSTNLNDLQWRQMPAGEYEVTKLTATTDNQSTEVVRTARTPRITSTVKNQVRAIPAPPSSRDSNRSYGNPEKTQDEEDAELAKLNIINSQTGKKMTVAEIKQQISYVCDGLARSAGIGSLSFPCKNFRVQRTFTAMDPDSTPPDEDAKHKARMAKMVVGVGISLCLLVILIVTGLLLHQWHERVVRQKRHDELLKQGKKEAKERAERKNAQQKKSDVQLTAQELREIRLAQFMANPNGCLAEWKSFGKLASDLLGMEFPHLTFTMSAWNTELETEDALEPLNTGKLLALPCGLQVEIVADDDTVALVEQTLNTIDKAHCCEKMGKKNGTTAFFVLYRSDLLKLREPETLAPEEEWEAQNIRKLNAHDSESVYQWTGMKDAASYLLSKPVTVTSSLNGITVQAPLPSKGEVAAMLHMLIARSPAPCKCIPHEPKNGHCFFLILPDDGTPGTLNRRAWSKRTIGQTV